LNNAGSIPGAIKTIYGKTPELKNTKNVLGLSISDIAKKAWVDEEVINLLTPQSAQIQAWEF